LGPRGYARTGGAGANISIDAVDVLGELVSGRDTTAPSTSSNAKPAYPDSATVTLSPSDAESGIATTYYRLDGGDWTEGLTFSTSDIGSHVAEFYSVDIAGNVESTRTATFDVLTRHDDADARLSWSGAWKVSSNSIHHAGGIRYAETGDASVTFNIVGTGFDVISFMSTRYGTATLAIDGGQAVDIDMYRSGTTAQGVSYSIRELEQGPHAVTLTRTGALSSGTSANVSIDAIDVLGTLSE